MKYLASYNVSIKNTWKFIASPLRQVALVMMTVAVSAQWYQSDSADVAMAKAKHYAAYIAAASRNGVAVNPIYHDVPNPVQDTIEVQMAKAQHFAAHAATKNNIAIPVVYQNDAPEVAMAKAEHYAAYVATAASNDAAVPAVYYNIPNAVQYTIEVQMAKAELRRSYCPRRGTA